MSTLLEKNRHEFLNALGGSSPVLVFGLGWDNVKSSLLERLAKKEKTADLDISCVLYDGNNDRVDTVWYAQLASKCGSVRHKGDDTVGTDNDDDETIQIDLANLPDTVKTLFFVISAFSQDGFRHVDKMYWRLFDGQTKREIVRAHPDPRTPVNAKIVMRLQKHEQDGLVQWSVKALDEAATGKNIQEVFPELRSLIEG